MEYDASIPIYLQVIEGIKKEIISGKIQLGEKLPSTRELAIEKKINANTAARIYKELEYMDIAFTKRGIGTFITESQGKKEQIKNDLSEGYVGLFMENMFGLGYDKAAICELLKNYKEKE